MADGRQYLGTAVGLPTFVDDYVADKVASWTKEIDRLSSIANTQPMQPMLLLRML